MSSQSQFPGGIPFAPHHLASNIGWTTKKKKRKKKKRKTSMTETVQPKNNFELNETVSKMNLKKNQVDLDISNSTLLPKPSNNNMEDTEKEDDEDDKQSLKSYSSINKSMDSESDGPFSSSNPPPKRSKKTSSKNTRTNRMEEELLSTYGGGYTFEQHEQSKEEHREELLMHCPPSTLLSPKEFYKQLHLQQQQKQTSSLQAQTNYDPSMMLNASTPFSLEEIIAKNGETYSILTLTNPGDVVTITGMAQVEIVKGNFDIFGYSLTTSPTKSTPQKDINENQVHEKAFNQKSISLEKESNSYKSNHPKSQIRIVSPSWMSTLTICNTNPTQASKIKLSSISWSDPISPSSSIDPVNTKSSSSSTSPSFQIMDPLFNENKAFPITIPQPWKIAADRICSSITSSFNDEINPNITTPTTSKEEEKTATPDASMSESPSHTAPTTCASKDKLSTWSQSPKILICGATHVGKSTCVRYLINRILSHQNDETVCSLNETSTDSNNRKGVIVLDCDVGQPEFNPPGMLSLTQVVEPIFSPPYAHMVMDNADPSTAIMGDEETRNMKTNETNILPPSNRNLVSYFFGDTSSKADPTRYTTAIFKLMNAYESYHQSRDQNKDSDEDQEEDHCEEDHWEEMEGTQPYTTTSSSTLPLPPLIVNTDGWVKGMGAEILSSIIDIVNPTHIIQILGHSKSKQFELPLFSIHSNCQVYSVQTFQRGQNQLLMRTLLPNINSMTTNRKNVMENNEGATILPKINNNAGHAKSVHLRALRFCTYFMGGASSLNSISNLEFTQSGFLDRNGYFAAMIGAKRPYTISFDHIHFWIQSEEAQIQDYLDGCEKQSLLLDGLNASVVALCSLTQEIDKDSFSKDTFNKTNQIPRCLGLGIVRSIDRRRRLFYVLTPLSLNTLAQVNCMIGGGKLVLPQEFFSPFGRGVCSSFPYQCVDGLMAGMIGSHMIKSRGHGDA